MMRFKKAVCSTAFRGQDRLQLFFSTHDVTLSGWRLRDFLRLLRDGKVAAKTGHARYANLLNDLLFVAEIKFAQIKTDG
ncbi:MAG: hypothetical protein ACTHLK_22995 [Brucella intermedia]